MDDKLNAPQEQQTDEIAAFAADMAEASVPDASTLTNQESPRSSGAAARTRLSRPTANTPKPTLSEIAHDIRQYAHEKRAGKPPATHKTHAAFGAGCKRLSAKITALLSRAKAWFKNRQAERASRPARSRPPQKPFPAQAFVTGVIAALLIGVVVFCAVSLRGAIGEFWLELTATPAPVVVDVTAEPTPKPAVLQAPTFSPEPTATPVATPIPTRHPENGDIIKEDDHEPIVLDIQIHLMTLGYLSFEEPDEDYGAGVAAAISSFQKRAGLPQTGETDGDTFRALMSPNAPEFAVVKGDSGDEVAIIRERLTELGYLPESDGAGDDNEDRPAVYDDETADAVRRFRAKNKLPASNEIDNEAFEVLLGEDPVSNYYAEGDKSDDILALQNALYSLGYLVGKPDGVFGKLTTLAVRRFQEENGLTPDGCLGVSTMSALKSGTATAYAFAKDSSGSDVQYIQKKLADLGYLSSSQVTGYYGDKTESAVKNFQGRNGLKKTGIADAKTIAKLNSPNAKKAAIQSSGGGGSSPAKSTPPPSGDKGGSSGSGGSTINYGQGVEAFIKIAESKLGCRYVRGAKGPNTFDCSGFAYWCLNQAGVNQGYMTSIGWRTCTKYQRITDMSKLKRGDVLIFSGAGSGKGHVGIYVGEGMMVDAGSSVGKVVRRSIRTTYWERHFLMAYRIWD